MAIVSITPDALKKIEKFEIKCKKCGSDDIEIQIDWAAYPSASWNITTIICKNCNEDEEIFDSHE